MYRIYLGFILALALAIGGCEYDEQTVESDFAQAHEGVSTKPIVECIRECKYQYEHCLEDGSGEAYCKRMKQLCISGCRDDDWYTHQAEGTAAQAIEAYEPDWSRGCRSTQWCGTKCCNATWRQYCCEWAICSINVEGRETCP